MLATGAAAPELIRLANMRDMLRSPGPCVTILFPPYHPGEPTGSPAAILKAYLQEAARQLATRGYSKALSSNLLHPLEELSHDADFAAGWRWSQAIFRSPGVLERLLLAQPVPAFLAVGGSFAIRQLSAELARPRLFYILALAKNHVKLLRCAGLHAELAKLPHGVPETLEEAMQLEPPDHDLENRSPAGVSTGAMHGVRFGTGSGRETRHAHLGDFYKLVDRGLQELLRTVEAPLVLAGVDEDASLYRSVSANPHLLKRSIAGSVDVSEPLTGTLQQAYGLLRADAVERQTAILTASRESATPARFSTDAHAILHAALAGRVAHLFLNEDTTQIDVFERGNYQSWGREDLLNLAAVQTAIHHGKYCEVPASAMPASPMPDACAAAALMRY